VNELSYWNFGVKLAEGSCGSILENKSVIEAYLGTEAQLLA